ncbi:unnamed protein product [Paramecium pentaurelia]|uniref:Uncharacterized protein n=1 Tax=Paramecium pentaurelia TaxID=43138 RepID=A0A8S1SVT2_9CILI|nr:unnamed protein product [Paramecium pentaurelia]
MNWIQSKQMSNLKIFYTGINCFYQRGDIIFDYLPPLNSQYDDRVEYFRMDKEQICDGSFIERCQFKDQIYSLKYKYHFFQFYESTKEIHRKYDDNIMIQQIKNQKQSQSLINIQNHNQIILFFKFLQECIINYSSLVLTYLFEKQSIQSELCLDEDEEELNKYLCNYIDTCDFQPKETDEKYVNEHYRYDINYIKKIKIYIINYFKKYVNANSLVKFQQDGLLQEGVIIAFCNFKFDIDASYAAIMNWIKWIRQHRINRLSAKQFPEFNGILEIVGESKCGRQVVYIKQSKLQPDKIDLERYKWYFLGFLEDVCRSLKRIFFLTWCYSFFQKDKIRCSSLICLGLQWNFIKCQNLSCLLEKMINLSFWEKTDKKYKRHQLNILDLVQTLNDIILFYQEEQIIQF